MVQGYSIVTGKEDACLSNIALVLMQYGATGLSNIVPVLVWYGATVLSLGEEIYVHLTSQTKTKLGQFQDFSENVLMCNGIQEDC